MPCDGPIINCSGFLLCHRYCFPDDFLLWIPCFPHPCWSPPRFRGRTGFIVALKLLPGRCCRIQLCMGKIFRKLFADVNLCYLRNLDADFFYLYLGKSGSNRWCTSAPKIVVQWHSLCDSVLHYYLAGFDMWREFDVACSQKNTSPQLIFLCFGCALVHLTTLLLSEARITCSSKSSTPQF